MSGGTEALVEARAAVATLVGHGEDPGGAAGLLADELVSNALLHGGGRFTLDARRREDVLSVEVHDHSPFEPRLLTHDPEREHGRGLVIVAALADAWGTRREDGGKCVWFELRLRR